MRHELCDVSKFTENNHDSLTVAARTITKVGHHVGAPNERGVVS